MAKFIRNGPVELYYNNALKFATTSDGATITGELGFASGGTYQLKLSDNQKIRFGGGNDLQIYHDGSINRIRSDVLTVIEKNDSEDMASFMPDGAVVLFHDGSQNLNHNNWCKGNWCS